MDRRRVIVGVATALTAGCLTRRAPSGPRTPPPAESGSAADGSGRADETTPEGDLQLREWDFTEADTGLLSVAGVIVNTVAQPRDGEVIAEAEIPDRTLEERLSVTVPPNDTEEFVLTFDLDYAEFAADGRLRVRVDQQTRQRGLQRRQFSENHER